MYAGKVNLRKQQVEGNIEAGKNGTAVKVVVGLDGYDYGHYKRVHQWSPTKGLNVHLSMNGPLQLTFRELEDFAEELVEMVQQAREELEANGNNQGNNVP